GSHPGAGVDLVAVLVRLEVQVTGGGVAGGADVADDVAAGDRAGAAGEAIQVVVGRHQVHPVDHPMVQDHLVTAGVRPGVGDDRPGPRGIHRLSAPGPVVASVVILRVS